MDFLDEIIFGNRAIFGLDVGLIQNGLTELISLLITVFLVNRIYRNRERKRWRDVEDNALHRLNKKLSVFVDENFKMKQGRRASAKTLLGRFERLHASLRQWGQASTLPFMLGNNRSYADLSECVFSFQVLIFFLESICKEVSKKSVEGPEFYNFLAPFARTEFEKRLVCLEKFQNDSLNPRNIPSEDDLKAAFATYTKKSDLETESAIERTGIIPIGLEFFQRPGDGGFEEKITRAFSD